MGGGGGIGEMTSSTGAWLISIIIYRRDDISSSRGELNDDITACDITMYRVAETLYTCSVKRVL